MNPQSQGTVELQSDDPTCPPRIDPGLLRHEFDRRMMIDGLRETRRLLSNPVSLKKTVKSYFPDDDFDEAIWVTQYEDGSDPVSERIT